MNASELVQSGKLDLGLQALQEEIRNKPEDQSLRLFLFQLNCVLGRWEKALTQLQVVASLTAETMLLAQIFRPVIACEMLRQEVFAGNRSALIFGEPFEWVGKLVEANGLTARGEFAAASALREQAFEAAPASPGKMDGVPFAWVADADSRLGPLLEVILDGKYYWIPFCRIQKIETEKPSDLRDLVWLPARFTWTNGGAAPGHIPVRYTNSENAPEDALKLARKTDWISHPGNTMLGLGQRLLATDQDDYPLLGCRAIEFETVT